MKKIILLLGILLACSAVATASDSLRTIYTSYIGVREATGRNDGPQVEMFLQHVGLRKGEPWCAAFVSYCLHKAGRASAPYSGWSPAFFPERYRIRRDTTLLPGDVFGIYYQNLRRIAHVGFVDTVLYIHIRQGTNPKQPVRYFAPNTDFIPTVEGNTNNNGSREGIGVFRKLRPIKTLRYISRYPIARDAEH